MLGLIRRLLGRLRKILFWLFLFTLPLTIFPIFGGAFGGVLFPLWDSRHVDRTTEKFFQEVRDVLTDWGVGGGVPSFREFQDTHNDFGLTRLNSNDWAPKMSVLLPDEYAYLEDDSTPINRLGDIQKLMRLDSEPATKPKETWVYITDFGWPAFNAWDSAFQYMVRYAQGDRHLNETGLFFAPCQRSAGFLCGVWNVRAPALVHFVVEDNLVDAEAIENGLTYCGNTNALRPVTARVINFPLKDAYTGHTLDVFPSYENQMHAVMTQPAIYEQFEGYEPMDQMMYLFNEYTSTFGNHPHEILYWIWETDKLISAYITDPLGMENVMMFIHTLSFILTTNLVQTVFWLPYRLITTLTDEFLAKPKQGDYILGDLFETENQDDPDDWMADLWKLAEDLGKSESSPSVTGGILSTVDVSPENFTSRAGALS